MDFIKSNFYFITIPPLFPLLLSFILGIIYQETTSFSIATSALCIILLTITHFFFKKSDTKRLILCILAPVFFFSGIFFYQKEIDYYHSFYSFVNTSPVDIAGTVEDITQTTVCNKKNTVITLQIHSVKKDLVVKKINKYCLLYGENFSALNVGDVVTFFHVKCKKPKNEHFTFYQIRELVVAALFNSTTPYAITFRPTFSFKRLIFDTKKTIIKKCKKKLSSRVFTLFSSLFLGNRSLVKESMDDINEHFKRWGIYHFLSRSGLHLALFVFLWQLLFRYTPLPFTVKNGMLLLLCIIYSLFSWSSIPFARSLFLFLCNKLCLLSGSSYNLLHYLTLTSLCFLIHSPLYLFFLDFQLTFGITFVLAWFNQLHSQHLYQESLIKKANY